MSLAIDPALLAAAQRGEPRALDRLLRQAQPDIRRYARRQCRAGSAIEDVVQEALIVLYRRIDSLRDPAAIGGWLARVVGRLCLLPVLGLLRGAVEWAEPLDTVSFAHRPVNELGLDLARGLESLPAMYRQILLLRDVEQQTINEAAAALSLTRAATKSRLHRARAMMREYLQDDGGGR